MAIEFVCESTTDFDAATGRSTTCPHRFSVSDEKAGDIIECPVCNNFVSVPEVKMPSKAASRKRQAPHRKLDIEKKPLGSSELLSDEPPAIEAEGKLSHQRLDSYQFCRNCGGALNLAVPDCPHCGAPRKASWADDQPLDEIQHQPAGLQLWLLSMIAGQTGRAVWTLTNILLGFLLVVSIAGALFVRDILTIVLLIVIGVMAFTYWRLTRQTLRIARDKPPHLAFWQDFGWLMILQWLRIFSWKVPLSTLQDPVVINLKGQTLDDADLAGIPNIARAHVLELDGATIGDGGIRYLRGLQNLKYIVLRKTRVTDEGVYRLQQSIPRCWIWH